jgi:D-proline reductase (dithiol) PrdB
VIVNLKRIKNRVIAKLMSFYPVLSGGLIKLYKARETTDIPWSPVSRLLSGSKVAIVTTAGVHHENDMPFNMYDPDGDPSFRTIHSSRPASSLMITHDYYNHVDADRDINIVFPLERLKEFEEEGLIGEVADKHYGFMGHIDKGHIDTLITSQAPEVARRLKNNNVDAVILTPG